MGSEIWILISIIVSLVILKISWDYDALPYGLILIVGLFGFLFWGVWGLLIGVLVVGVIINFVLGLIFKILSKIFDIGLMRKKDRKLIAKGFISEHRNEIMALRSRHGEAMDTARRAGVFSKLSEKEIESSSKEFDDMYSDETMVDAYSRYINEIYAEATKVENPVKRHRWDMMSGALRENFIRGGQNWIEKSPFDSRPPFPSSSPRVREIKEKFVRFCEYVIFDNPERVGVISNQRKT